MNTTPTNQQNLNKRSIDNVFIDLTVRSMVNPDNHDFYINKLTIEQVEHLLNGADNELVECFWSAFARAHAECIEVEDNFIFDFDYTDTCPECHCRDYVEGVACPNCEYVEE